MWQGCQNCTLRVHRKVLSRKLFLKNVHFSHHFRILSVLFQGKFLNCRHSIRNISPSGKKTEQVCQNRIVRDLGNNLGRNNFFLKIAIFYLFWPLSYYFVGAVVKTVIYVSIWTFWSEFFLKNLKFSLFFSDIWRKIFGLLGNLYHGAAKPVLCVFRRTFEGSEETCQEFLKKFFILSFCSFERKFLASWTSFFFFAGISKNPLYLIIRTFLSRKILLKKVHYFVTFGYWTNKFRASGRKFLTRL